MLLAPNALISTVATALLGPGCNQQRRGCVVGNQVTHPVFSGISRWPNLDQIFAQISQELIVRHGVNDWALAGGILRSNGRPSFGNPATAAYKTLRNLIDVGAGFTYFDDARVQWAVLASEDPDGDCTAWRGNAIGMSFPLNLLEQQWRNKCLQSSYSRLEELVRPGKILDLAGQLERARISEAHRRLVLIETAIKTIPALHLAAKAQESNRVRVDIRRLAAVAWGVESTWPAGWHDTVFEAITLLTTFRTQSLSLPKTGWCPATHRLRPAALSVERHDSHSLTVHLAAEFMKFTAHWLMESFVQTPAISSITEAASF